MIFEGEMVDINQLGKYKYTENNTKLVIKTVSVNKNEISSHQQIFRFVWWD